MPHQGRVRHADEPGGKMPGPEGIGGDEGLREPRRTPDDREVLDPHRVRVPEQHPAAVQQCHGGCLRNPHQVGDPDGPSPYGIEGRLDGTQEIIQTPEAIGFGVVEGGCRGPPQSLQAQQGRDPSVVVQSDRLEEFRVRQEEFPEPQQHGFDAVVGGARRPVGGIRGGGRIKTVESVGVPKGLDPAQALEGSRDVSLGNNGVCREFEIGGSSV
mmetsp:Transcript_7230/g.17452  ORF Transcript_7230/g.17452 Transcript_7230/m.17452 type:complete len:213 (+) Transcript_7230:1698-2336(+)